MSDAYERVKADHAGLRPEQLIAVNLDIPAAASTALGVLPELNALRDRTPKQLPSLDVAPRLTPVKTALATGARS